MGMLNELRQKQVAKESYLGLSREDKEGKTSSFFGPAQAIVVDNMDVDGLGSIFVICPEATGSQTVIKARPKLVGFHYIPQIGDNVFIEFESGDIGRPVWTGHTYNEISGASNAPEAGNVNIEGFFLRDGSNFFVDKFKKFMQIFHGPSEAKTTWTSDGTKTEVINASAFEDVKGVKNIKTAGDLNLLVGNNFIVSAVGNLFAKILGAAQVILGADSTVQVLGDFDLQIKAGQIIKIRSVTGLICSIQADDTGIIVGNQTLGSDGVIKITDAGIVLGKGLGNVCTDVQSFAQTDFGPAPITNVAQFTTKA